MALQKAVAKNSDFEFLPSGKIHCKLTSHDLMPTLEEFQKYLKGKSYKLAKERAFDLTEFEPYLVPYKKNENFMFCRLTGNKVTKLRTVIQKHMNGRKFLRLKKEHEEKQKEFEEKQKKKAEEKAKRIAVQKAAKAQSNGDEAGKPKKNKKAKGKHQAEVEEEEGEDDFDVEAFDEAFDSDMDEEGDNLLHESDDEGEETKANGHSKANGKPHGKSKKHDMEDEDDEEEDDEEDYEDIEDDDEEPEEPIKEVKKVAASKKIAKQPKQAPAVNQKLQQQKKKGKKH